MELRAGELQAPQAGLYYIYAQTYFRMSSSEETDSEVEEAAQLVQYIYKKVRLLGERWLHYPPPLVENLQNDNLKMFRHRRLENRLEQLFQFQAVQNSIGK